MRARLHNGPRPQQILRTVVIAQALSRLPTVALCALDGLEGSDGFWCGRVCRAQRHWHGNLELKPSAAEWRLVVMQKGWL